MLGQEEKVGVGGGTRKTYLRSISWSDRSPSSPNARPHQPNSKARSCLPPLQPLSISRRKVEEWPTAGADDLGEWPHPPTPGARRGVPIKTLENSDSLRPPPREFQLKKDKLAFFDKECSRIAEHIYLGSDAVAKNREILRHNGITHVLNCVGFVSPEYFKGDLVYKTLWLQDSPSEDITSILYDVFDYFEDVREQGGRVFVHCCQGVSRSSSLVIAYLIWRDGQSFEDAFQYVKAARGVTNPNMGFACQLLQCQKRVHAVPVSPRSLLRMYRMAPHSPYDPLHLVPKMLSHPGALGLDSRGAFIVHVPSTIYVWIGRNCNPVMSNNARTAAFQVVHYERAKGPIVSVEEGEEPLQFWDALTIGSDLSGDCDKSGKDTEEVNSIGSWCAGKDDFTALINLGVGKKKVAEYDMDFEIFNKALCGGVVPPFPLSGTGLETHLPARENGWGRLRRKFASGIMKELVTASKLTYENAQPNDKPDEMMVSCKEMEQSASPTENILSPTLPYGSPDSFSLYSNVSSKASPKSTSPSPSPSDSSSFTFSPASSNWSNFSFLSSQPSPSALEPMEPFKNVSMGEKDCLGYKSKAPITKPLASLHALKTEKASSQRKGTSPSLAERRGSNPPSLLLFPSTIDPSQPSRNLARSWSFSLDNIDEDLMMDSELDQFDHEGFSEPSRRDRTSDPEINTTGNELLFQTDDQKMPGEVCLPTNDSMNEIVELTEPVLYQWPLMEKVGMCDNRILSSRSVFLLLAPDINLGKNKPGVLYVWVGRDVSTGKDQNQFTGSSSKREDIYVYWKKIGCNFLDQMGLPLDVPIQIVKEGDEPEQLLDNLNHLLFHKV